MFKFRNFVFGRRDKFNIDLYQIQSKEISEGGGKGKGRPKGTGVFEDRPVLIGHFSSLENLVYKMMLLDSENYEFKDILTQMDNFKKDIKEFFTDIKLSVKNLETEGKYAGEEDSDEDVEED